LNDYKGDTVRDMAHDTVKCARPSVADQVALQRADGRAAANVDGRAASDTNVSDNLVHCFSP
jgi:hypothetical protein